METIWIIGAGYFGLKALQKLSDDSKDRCFVLVDPVMARLKEGEGNNCSLVHEDGVIFLKHHLFSENTPDWIIPTLPLHLAAEWCLIRLGTEQAYRIPLPSAIKPLFPNALRGENGDMYISHANFRCPEDCPEPRNICTATRSLRNQNMFELLENTKLPPFKSLVIRSHQIMPGIGGYKPEHLADLFSQLEKLHGEILVSTACRCHGVITGMKKTHRRIDNAFSPPL